MPKCWDSRWVLHPSIDPSKATVLKQTMVSLTLPLTEVKNNVLANGGCVAEAPQKPAVDKVYIRSARCAQVFARYRLEGQLCSALLLQQP